MELMSFNQCYDKKYNDRELIEMYLAINYPFVTIEDFVKMIAVTEKITFEIAIDIFHENIMNCIEWEWFKNGIN